VIALLSTSLVAEEISFDCSKDGSFPDPEDCGKYYVCTAGQVFPMVCPGGLHFDVALGTCNTPSQANCQISSSSSPTTPTPTPTPTTQSPTPTPTPTTQSPTPSPTPTPTTQSPTPTPSTARPDVPQCPESGTILLPDAKNCSLYYVCVNGGSFPVTCPEGYYFSEALQNCDVKENVQCKSEVLPKCPPNGTALVPDPADCSAFYVCIDGSFDRIECPNGYNFNVQQGRCDLEENVNCDNPLTPDCPKEGWVQIPNPKECASYYLCVDGDASFVNCPESTGFDPEHGVCSFTAPCLNGTSSTSSTSSSSTSSSSTSSSSTTSSSTTSSSTTSTTSSPIGDCKEEGELLPNPNDCSTFFQCVGGSKVELECPPGLEFNAEAKVCDNPSTANCSH